MDETITHLGVRYQFHSGPYADRSTPMIVAPR